MGDRLYYSKTGSSVFRTTENGRTIFHTTLLTYAQRCTDRIWCRKKRTIHKYLENACLCMSFRIPCRGLDYHVINNCGYRPAGLVEEIRALTMPVIPWDVELAHWFETQFPPFEKYCTYTRPSRRQGAAPDIPRPSYSLREQNLENRLSVL